MKKELRIFLVLFCFFLNHLFESELNAQNRKLDSLNQVLKTTGLDTNRVRTLNAITLLLISKDIDSALVMGNDALSTAEKIKWLKGIGYSHHALAIVNARSANYRMAISHYKKAILVWDSLIGTCKPEMKRTWLIAKSKSEGNLGIVYKNMGNYTMALNVLTDALKIDESIENKKGIGIQLGAIGNIYVHLEEYPKAITYFRRALDIANELHERWDQEVNLGNIGNAYHYSHQYDSSLYYALRSLKISEEDSMYKEMAIGYGGVANVYYDRGDYYNAEIYYNKSVTISELINDKLHLPIWWMNLGMIKIKTGRFEQSEMYLSKALNLAKQIESVDLQKEIHEYLYELYDTTGRYELALMHYKQFIVIRDSIFNTENIKKQTQTELQYEFDKQSTADSIRNSERQKQDNLKHDNEIHQQRIYTYGGIIGFVLMLIVAVVSFRAFRQKHKANEIISRQKLIVEVKQQEILDSIHYAKRIQQSMMPTEKYIARNLNDLTKNK